MKNIILEMAEKKNKAGRRNFKIVLHEIHNNPSKFNANGISWNEQYVLDNIDSAIGIPLCAEFIDMYDKEQPFGHGFTGVKDNKILFEDSVVVGVINEVNIENIEINGKNVRVLTGAGDIFEQRFPQFTQWLKAKMYDKEPPVSSVEIMAKDGNEFIIYEDGYKDEGRIPKVYSYSGHCVLGVSPADDSAIMLELNNNKFKKEDELMSKEVISELNAKLETKTNEINSLTNEVNSLKKDIESKDGLVSELNSKVEEKEVEINSIKEELDTKKEELENLISEINELKEYKVKAESEKLVSELNQKLSAYTDEEKECVKEKVEVFSKEPSQEKIVEIVNEINADIVAKQLEERKKQTEKNSDEKVDDIYSDVYEYNSDVDESIY